MKIRDRLLFTFITIIFFFGITSYLEHRHITEVTHSFKKLNDQIAPSLTSLLELLTGARRASVKAMEFSLRGKPQDRAKAEEAIENIDEQLQAFLTLQQQGVSQLTLDELVARKTQFVRVLREYLQMSEGSDKRKLLEDQELIHKTRIALTKTIDEALPQASGSDKYNLLLINSEAQKVSLQLIDFFLRSEQEYLENVTRTLDQLNRAQSYFIKNNAHQNQILHTIPQQIKNFESAVRHYLKKTTSSTSTLEDIYKKQEELHTTRKALIHTLYPFIEQHYAALALASDTTAEQLAQAGRLKVYSFITLTIITLIAVILLSNTISNPLGRLSSLLNRFGKGEKIKPDEIDINGGSQELRQLSESVAAMMRERDTLYSSIQENERFVRMLLDTTPIGLALTRLDGSLVEVNPAFAAITGHSIDEILDLSYWDITPIAYSDQEQVQLEKLNQTGRYGPYEKEYLHKDGHTVPVRLSGRLIESKGEQYIWSTVEDLSAVRESKILSNRLKNILEHSYDEVYIFDCETLHFLQVSRGALMNLGYNLEEMQAITPVDLKPDFTEEKFNALIDPLRSGKKKQLVFGTRHQRKDGSYYPVEVRLQVSGEGSEAVFFAIILDLTEREKAEEALRLTQFSLDHAPDAVFWMQEDGGVRYVNDEACRSLGYTREELMGMHIWDFDPGTQQKQWQQHWKEMRQLGHNTLEAFHRCKNGHIHPVEMSVVRTSYKGTELHSAFVRDITQRKQAEEDMRRSNAVLNAVNHAQTQFIGRCSAADIFTDLLNAILELTGSEYGFIGEVMHTDEGTPYIKTHGITNIAWNDDTRKFFEESAPNGLDFYQIDNLFGYAILHRELVIANDPSTDPRSAGVPEGHPPIRCFMGIPFFDDTDVLGMIAIANRPGGYNESLLPTLEPLLIASKNIIGSLRVDQRRVAAEEAIRDLNEELEERVEQRTATVRMQAQIIDQTHDSVITTDLEGMITSWNGGAERLFGIPAKDAEGQHISFVYPDDQNQFVLNEIITQIIENGQHDMEVNMLRADGTLFPAHLSLSLLYDDTGAPRGIVGYSIDISEQKKREQKLDELAHRLQASNKELESFSYSVSHDLRAPLRAIDGFSLALAEDYGDQLDETAHDYLQRVRKSAQRMGLLIDDLLQLSRVNRQELAIQDVDLGEIAISVMEELQASEPHRKVELSMAPDLYVQGDPRLLRVIMDNLLGNAWKFTSQKPNARITFGRKADDPQIIYINDNGVGFDMRHADKLFGAFQRLHRASEFPGTGVGLATVQRIVHRHGGKVWAEAQEGEGATFYFSLGPQKQTKKTE